MIFGHCFTFPFFFLCNPDHEKWEDVNVSRHNLTIYPPFRSGPYWRKSSPEADLSISPPLARRGILFRKEAVLSATMYPTLEFDESGEAQITLVVQNALNAPIPTPKFSLPPLNSLHIDVKALSQDSSEALVKKLLQNGLRRLRRRTLQFWIGQQPSYFDSFLSFSYQANRNYEIEGSPIANSAFFAPNKRTVPISQEIWGECWRSSDREIELDWVDYLLDAQHFVAGQELSKAVMQIGLAIESIKYGLWSNIHSKGHCNKSAFKDAIENTSKPQAYFSEKLEAVCQRNFAKESPEQFVQIERAWVARGMVAHGKEGKVAKAIGQEFDAKCCQAMIDSVVVLQAFSEAALHKDAKK